MDRNNVPQAAIERLPKYMKALRDLREHGARRVSSTQIAARSGGNSAQVRKDLSYLGELGVKGSGYDVEMLLELFADLVGVVTPRKVALFGYGRLGAALFAYGDFMRRGFHYVAVFETDPEKIGTQAEGVEIQGLDVAEDVMRERGVDVAIIATPPAAAQDIADRATAAGVRAILNMTPQHVELPAEVHVRHTCLCTELQILSFFLAREDDPASQ